jgi:Cu-Zn family superoxide dismutase
MKTHLGMAAMMMVVMGGALAWACSDDASTPATSDRPSDSGTSSGSSGTPGTDSSTSDGSSGGPARLEAKADIRPTSDASTVEGTAEFVETGSVTVVTIAITSSGGTPGEHGIHIHEHGSCDPVDGGAGLAAGGHWNPADAGHAYPSTEPRHLGDLGNITIDESGKGSSKLTFPSSMLYVHEGPDSVVGHAVIYHAQKDDGVSQPAGNAGARSGCGVIRKQ